MNKQQRSSIVNLLLVIFFVLQLVVFFRYVPCETYEELLEKNWLVFKLDKISWFALTLAGFLISKGSNKSVFRVIFVAVSYSTMNEITGLNNYSYSLEYPVFCTLILSTVIYSIWKHEPS